MADQSAFAEVLHEFRGKVKAGFAVSIVHYGDIGQRGGCGNADAQRLAKSFLGSKALGQKTRRVFGLFEIGAFKRCQQLVQCPFAVALIKFGEPGNGCLLYTSVACPRIFRPGCDHRQVWRRVNRLQPSRCLLYTSSCV